MLNIHSFGATFGDKSCYLFCMSDFSSEIMYFLSNKYKYKYINNTCFRCNLCFLTVHGKWCWLMASILITMSLHVFLYYIFLVFRCLGWEVR